MGHAIQPILYKTFKWIVGILNRNISSKDSSLGGKIRGNVSSDRIKIKKTADVEGVLNQKTLSIEEGAMLKIKTETYK